MQLPDDRVYYRAGYKYVTTRPFSIYLPEMSGAVQEVVEKEGVALHPKGLLMIEAGWPWDGASGPTIDTRSTIRGSLTHDALYLLLRAGLLAPEWKDAADMVIGRLCREDGMWWLRARAWMRGLWLFGGGYAATGEDRPELVAP